MCEKSWTALAQVVLVRCAGFDTGAKYCTVLYCTVLYCTSSVQYYSTVPLLAGLQQQNNGFLRCRWYQQTRVKKNQRSALESAENDCCFSKIYFYYDYYGCVLPVLVLYLGIRLLLRVCCMPLGILTFWHNSRGTSISRSKKSIENHLTWVSIHRNKK